MAFALSSTNVDAGSSRSTWPAFNANIRAQGTTEIADSGLTRQASSTRRAFHRGGDAPMQD